MSKSEAFVLAKVSNRIGHLTLNRPNSPNSLNALNLPMIRLLWQQLHAWQNDPEVIAVVLRGAGERAFCAGSDIRSLYDSLQAQDGTGNTILITGGTSGIGLGLALRFYEAGNKVIVAGRRKELLDQIMTDHPGIEAIVLEVADPASIAQASETVAAKYPELLRDIEAYMAHGPYPDDIGQPEVILKAMKHFAKTLRPGNRHEFLVNRHPLPQRGGVCFAAPINSKHNSTSHHSTLSSR